MGLCLLSQASLPQKFSLEAFSTSMFLINRLPMAQLKFDTSYTKLTNNILDYKFLKIFGCTCPLLTPYNSKKLQAKSTKRVPWL